ILNRLMNNSKFKTQNCQEGRVGGYALRRIGQALLFISLATVFMFTFLLYFIPGGPGQRYQGLKAALMNAQNAADPSNPASRGMDPQQLEYIRSEVHDMEKFYKLD